MSRRKPKKRESPVSFQLTPMIDMTFLLLIFFMVTARLTDEDTNQEIRLAEAPSAVEPVERTGRFVINVNADGAFLLGTAEISEAALKRRLEAEVQRDPDLRVYLRADRESIYQHTKVLNKIASEAGVAEAIYATLQSP
ncbi:MAG: biopolymer transporter ExbD [Verrucomicrobiota bacterium]